MGETVVMEALDLEDCPGKMVSTERQGNREYVDLLGLLGQEVGEPPTSGGVAPPALMYLGLNWFTKEELLEVTTHTVVEAATISVSQWSQQTLILVRVLWMHLCSMALNMKCGEIFQSQTSSYMTMMFPVLYVMLLLAQHS